MLNFQLLCSRLCELYIVSLLNFINLSSFLVGLRQKLKIMERYFQNEKFHQNDTSKSKNAIQE